MIKIRNVIVGACAALAVALTSAAALAADMANLTGTWNLSVDSPMGKRTPSMTLTQKGDAVTGTYKGPSGDVPVTGKVTGGEFTLSVTMSMQGQEMVMAYNGKVTGDDMQGNIAMGQMGDAAFTGKREAAAKP